MLKQSILLVMYGSLVWLFPLGLKAQELILERKKVYNAAKVEQYYKRLEKSQSVIEKTGNIPISIFFMNENVCGYFMSKYETPFSKGYHFSTKWTGFVTCLNFKGTDPEMVYVNYIYEHLLREKKPKSLKSSLKMVSYYKKKEDIVSERFKGPINYVAFDDKLLLFYTYDKEEGEDKVQKMEVFSKLLLVKEYNSSLQLTGKHKVELAKIRSKKIQFGIYMPGQHAGEVYVTNIEAIKLNNERFAVIYNVVKVLGRYSDEVTLMIKIFDKNMNLINEVSIEMPFPVSSDVNMIPSYDGNNLYFAVPVVVEQESEAKGLLNKLVGSKDEDRVGLFLFIYNVDLVNGTHDFRVVDLGNPEKRVVSSVFKRSATDKDVFLIGLMWKLGKNSYGADIVKINIGNSGDFALLDQTTVNIGESTSVKYGLKMHKTIKMLSDIYELNNHYLLLLGDVLVIQNEVSRQNGSTVYVWYKNSLHNPTLVSVHKQQKTKKEFKLYVGQVLSYDTDYMNEVASKSVFDRNLLQTIGFVDIGAAKDKVMIVFAVREGSKHAPTQSRYLFVSENSNGDIDVLRAKSLGVRLGSSSSFGARTVTYKNGKIYGIFSINYRIPAAAEYGIKH